LLSLLTNKDSYNIQIIQCVNDTIFRKRFRVPGFGTGSGTLEPVPWNRFLRHITNVDMNLRRHSRTYLRWIILISVVLKKITQPGQSTAPSRWPPGVTVPSCTPVALPLARKFISRKIVHLQGTQVKFIWSPDDHMNLTKDTRGKKHTE